MGGFFFCNQPYSDGRRFRDALSTWFGETTLDDLHARGRHVAITSFNANPWRPRFYRSFGPGWSRNAEDGERTLREVAHDTSSVPGIGPVALSRGVAYLDGFLASNNPAMSALAVIVRDIVRREHPGEDPFDHVMMLSLGVGQSLREARIEERGGLTRNLIELLLDDVRLLAAADQESLTDAVKTLFGNKPRGEREALGRASLNWGALDLFGHLVYLADMMFHGQSGEVDHNCERLLGSARFHRYEPRIALMRAVVRFLIKRGDGSTVAMEALYRACFRDDVETAPEDARDAEENRDRTRRCPRVDRRELDGGPAQARRRHARRRRGRRGLHARRLRSRARVARRSVENRRRVRPITARGPRWRRRHALRRSNTRGTHTMKIKSTVRAGGVIIENRPAAR